MATVASGSGDVERAAWPIVRTGLWLGAALATKWNAAYLAACCGLVVLWKVRQVFTAFPREYQLLVCNDASTDDSLEVLERLRAERGWDFTVLSNRPNSGSVFEQWRKGVEAARGDLVWIAEADDYADPGFLTGLAPLMDDPDVVLAYSQSRQVDEEGQIIAPDYLEYVKDVDHSRWTSAWGGRSR